MPQAGPTGGYFIPVNLGAVGIDPASAVHVTKQGGDPTPCTVAAVGPTGFSINFSLPAGPLPFCTFSYIVVPP